ncbi:MAG: hypothetical protein DI587_36140 [Variovorax paradoxus]|nr:MAG: hypothetical protein DI583_36140 [Variovorax paradoxus]PZQ00833.1 MAG: hypothetical protein DI587_36140 [Variovorax paradoxus]
MTDRHAPGRNALQEEPPEDSAGTRSKVVALRLDQQLPPPERLDPRLEEMRRILAESKPLDSLYSDDEVIADEGKFRKRFGPGFRWNRRDRIGLIALKNRYDLTDPEIQLFQHTGNLHRSVFGVRLTASPWIALWGGVQIMVFGLLFLVLLLAAWPNLVTAPTKAIKPVLALLGLLTFCCGLYWMYVKPWLLHRRKERERRHGER